MEETKIIEQKYEVKELAEKLGIKGEIIGAEISMDEDTVDGVIIKIKEEEKSD